MNLLAAAWRCLGLTFIVAVIWVGGGAAAAPSAAEAACPSGSREDYARVQLWDEKDCGGKYVTVPFTGVGDRPDFSAFVSTNGKPNDVDNTRSSLVVADDHCVRLFDGKGYTGAASGLLCAESGARYVADLTTFHNKVSSMRVCSVLTTSSCLTAPPPPPDPCDPQPAAPGLQLGAAFSSSRRSARPRRSVVARYFGKRLRVSGRLTRADGSPVAGAPVCVASIDAVRGAGRRQLAMIGTDANGGFSYTLPRGPSRRVWFVHRVGAAAAAASVRTHVRARVSLRARPRVLRTGGRLRLAGSVRGAPRGSLVELQARRDGGWQTFRTTRTGTRGRFRGSYQFTRTQGVQRYSLRARVPRQSGLPYTTGGSRAVRVKVSG